MRQVTYKIAPRGLATSFTESELPIEFASEFRNRYINAAGGAEKRQGIERGEFTTNAPGNTTLTNLHEHVSKEGTATVFGSGSGRIYKWDGSSWSLVHTFPTGTGKTRSIQFGDKIIFYNGVDRNIYTEDAGETFTELYPIIERGTMASAATTSFTDGDISAWTSTDVNVNDLVYNITKDAYAVVTVVSAGPSLTHTGIGSAITGIGKADSNQAAGDVYQIHDMVELNIIPTTDVPDNVATAGSGTGATTITVSGLNFGDTECRVGDIVYNTTRAAVTRVEAVATAITVTSVLSQTAGDSLVFLKSAMPISSFMHAHFNRVYHVDARDQRKIRISGSNDAEDMTTDGGTLDPITFNYDLGSQGDVVKAIGSYQRFIVFAGRQSAYAYEGTQPIGTDANFTPIGSFPIGIVSPDGLLDIGNDLLLLTDDGMQSLRIVVDANALYRANVAEPIRVTLRDLIQNTSEDQLQLIHYPRRSWVLVKIGSQIFNYNYTPGITENETAYDGSWSLFDGLFAQQESYLVRQNGDLICAGAGGRAYEFDQGSYSDDGQAIATSYRTGWLTMEPPSSSTVRIKQGMYIKPLLQSGGPVTFTLRAEGAFEGYGNGTGSIPTAGATSTVGQYTVGTGKIGGSSTQNTKIPLRWRGEVMRLTITSENTDGPEILGRYTLYTVINGAR